MLCESVLREQQESAVASRKHIYEYFLLLTKPSRATAYSAFVPTYYGRFMSAAAKKNVWFRKIKALSENGMRLFSATSD